MKKIIFILLAITFCIQIFNTPAMSQQKAAETPRQKSLEEYLMTDLIDAYFDSLNEADNQRRADIVKIIWQKDGIFAYPGTEVQGFPAISADVLKVQKKYPNAVVRRTSELVIIENKYVRFNWEFGIPKAEPLIKGHDFAVIADGKLKLVVGYFDYISEKAK